MAGSQKKTATTAGNTQRVRVFEGKVVKPSLYYGPHGKYMVATSDGNILYDESGRPREYKKTGTLVNQ
ncbi:MAG: hypothetical protein QXN55_00875 [Candidatus Nitrosotenuis sp.]